MRRESDEICRAAMFDGVAHRLSSSTAKVTTRIVIRWHLHFQKGTLLVSGDKSARLYPAGATYETPFQRSITHTLHQRRAAHVE